tara:strand:+ start:1630 stop:2070 length:441 start_codon:yes stop_codon:yes gene_type:complete
MPQTTFKAVYEDVKTALEASGFVFSNTPFTIDETNLPMSGENRFFAIEFQTSNTDKFRDRQNGSAALQRVAHDLTVKMAFRIKPFDPLTTIQTLLDQEKVIIDKVVNPTTLASCRTLYRSSERRLSSSKEFFFVDVEFGVEQSWTV